MRIHTRTQPLDPSALRVSEKFKHPFRSIRPADMYDNSVMYVHLDCTHAHLAERRYTRINAHTHTHAHARAHTLANIRASATHNLPRHIGPTPLRATPLRRTSLHDSPHSITLTSATTLTTPHYITHTHAPHSSTLEEFYADHLIKPNELEVRVCFSVCCAGVVLCVCGAHVACVCTVRIHSST